MENRHNRHSLDETTRLLLKADRMRVHARSLVLFGVFMEFVSGSFFLPEGKREWILGAAIGLMGLVPIGTGTIENHKEKRFRQEIFKKQD